MRHAGGVLLAALVGLAGPPACGDAPQAPVAVETPAPEAVGEPSDAAAPSFHTRYGFPGPWSRESASRDDFDADSRSCQDRSREARRAGSDDPNEAAYRAFLECMDKREWTRGFGPKPAAPGPAEQSG